MEWSIICFTPWVLVAFKVCQPPFYYERRASLWLQLICYLLKRLLTRFTRPALN
ncbi:hypothetical protein DES53_10363 [Roseimicrobium gellanilyticum]|uniref:Uncharacterized protein n=1 Tax=Roseimicrobium gellanilyticum TaxID=748857 RepID=A0A366HNJ9_9BACT|nr:hypothetical protein DES53_10363 [Roseimicrobium gellanilyticum]